MPRPAMPQEVVQLGEQIFATLSGHTLSASLAATLSVAAAIIDQLLADGSVPAPIRKLRGTIEEHLNAAAFVLSRGRASAAPDASRNSRPN